MSGARALLCAQDSCEYVMLASWGHEASSHHEGELVAHLQPMARAGWQVGRYHAQSPAWRA